MHFASLCIGVFLFSLSIVIDGAIVKGKKTSGESQRQSTRIGRKLLGTADYPTFPVVPPTAFKCNPANPGYFADTEALCQVFHLCQIDGRHDSFLCPNGTLFNQKHFVCDWWYNVDCAAAPSLYVLNEVFQQPQQLSGREHANVRPHSVNAFVNPEASIQSYDVPSTISPASPSINRPQHAVTATIARKHSPTVGQQQQHPTTQFVNAADTYGSRMPGVNRMGGLDTVLHQNQIINRDKDESTTPVTDTQVLIELTEASPTTESFNEDEFGAHLKSQLMGVDEQLTIIPVTTNAAFSSQNNHVIGTAFLTLPNTDDSSNSFVVKTGDKLEASSDGAIESVQTLLTDNNNQLNEDELSTLEPNLADVQTSAVVVTFDSLPDVKDLDDEYTTTPLTSPTTDLAAHLLQVVAANATQESTTEDMASINKVNNAAAAAVDLSESNFVTGLEATTFPSVSFDDVLLFQTLPEVKTTTAPALIEPPIIEGLNFNVIADVKPLDLETKDNTAATVGPVDIQVFASAFAESSSGADDVDTVSNISSQLALTTEAISESSTDTTPELSTTVASVKGDDVIASAPLIANSTDAKKTLYEKLKPVIVGDGRPNIPAIYGRKIPRTGSKITKFSIV